MYTSLHIKGFRCFQDFKMEKLARLNLIGGKNNTGKTALLEALVLHGSAVVAPDPIVPSLYLLRRISEGEMAALGFRDLFVGFPDQGSATITTTAGRETRIVTLSCEDAEESERPLDVRQGTASVVDLSRVRERPDRALKISAGGVEASITISGDGHLRPRPQPGAWHRPGFFLDAARRVDKTFLAELFSGLRRTRREEPVIELLTHLEPRVKAVTVESLGRSPVLHGDLGSEGVVPFPFVGEGMHAVSAIVLGLAGVSGGVLLVDEIENGLHYSVLPDVWRAIAHAATELDVQVFATSHSHDCVEAAYEATAGMPEETFLYHRLDRIEGDIECQTYSERGLEIALQTGNEVR